MNNQSRQILVSEDVLIALANKAGISPESLTQGALVQRQANIPSEYLVPDDSFGPLIDTSNVRNISQDGIFG